MDLQATWPALAQVAQLRAKVTETEEALRRAEDERQHLQALQRLTPEQGSQATGEEAALQALRQKVGFESEPHTQAAHHPVIKASLTGRLVFAGAGGGSRCHRAALQSRVCHEAAC